MSALAVRDLAVAAQRDGTCVQIVERVDFELPAGSVLGVVGETGAGKTMTMRALLGMLPRGVRASGSVAFEGEPPIGLDEPRRLRAKLGRTTGLVLQNPAGMLDPLFRIGAQLTEGVLEHGLLAREQADARAGQLLEAMGLDAVAVPRLFPHQLSGGMAQRVAIAMAMMPRPRVLFVDEPTSALDAHVRVEVLRLLRAVAQEQGAAIVLVSHDLGLVSHFSDAVLVMYAGHVVERGPVGDVLDDPQHPYTRDLLACTTSLDGRGREPLTTIPGAPPAPGSWPSGCVFAPRCKVAVERSASERPALVEYGARAVACHRVADRMEASVQEVSGA